MITCEDLSAPGWRFSPGVPETATAVIGGRIVSCRDITGVLTRRPCVVGKELVQIRPEDREYVAAEMSAFLTAWLSSLSCPVLNRPTAACLCGPNWRPEQWAHAAAGVGIPVEPMRRRVPRRPALESGVRHDGGAVGDAGAVGVTVVGDRCLGTRESTLAAQARRLAKVAGVDLVEVRFSGPEARARFLGANLWPDLTRDGVAEAVLDYLSGRPAAHAAVTR